MNVRVQIRKSFCGACLHRWSLLILVCASVMVLPSCEMPAKKQQVARNDPPEIEQPTQDIRHGTISEPQNYFSDVNTAAKAAVAVVGHPAVDDPWTAREIALHAALYREALRGMVADNTKAVVLQPVRFDELPELSVDDREFYLRVLAAMIDVGIPVAWTTVEPPGQLEAEYFPGTRDLATRLAFEIIKRNDKTATVIAEVSDTTGHTGSSRQTVTATFDGLEWTTQRDGARLIW